MREDATYFKDGEKNGRAEVIINNSGVWAFVHISDYFTESDFGGIT